MPTGPGTTRPHCGQLVEFAGRAAVGAGDGAEGRGAVRKISAFPVEGLPNDVAAEIPQLDKKAMMDLALPRVRKAMTRSLKYMARDIQLAVAGAQMASSPGATQPGRAGMASPASRPGMARSAPVNRGTR